MKLRSMVDQPGVVMTLGLFNSFLDHQIFVPLGDSISFGTCDFEGGSS